MLVGGRRIRAWTYGGPNGGSLVEAQQAFLADERPYRQREGKVRAPRKKEAREPGWQPIELTDQLRELVEGARRENEQYFEDQRRRIEQELAENPEGRYKGYNADVKTLLAGAEGMAHRELKSRLRQISETHDVKWSEGNLEIVSRLMVDKTYYRRRPLRAAWWIVRHSRPLSLYRHRWNELRSGELHFAG